LARKGSKGGGKWLFDTLSSNRFAIYLIIAITVASLVGVIVPQRYISIAEPVYQERFSTGFLGFLRLFGIFDIFHTVWYRALVALFLLSLVLCSYKGVVRLFKLRREIASADFERLRELGRASEKLNADVGDERVRKVFGAFGRLRKREDKKGAFYFFQGGSWGRFGPYVIHTAVLLIVLGGLLGNLFGIDGSMNIPEGGKSSEIWLTRGGVDYDLGFTVECSDFDIEYHEGTRQPKDYKSRLRVIEGGRVVREKVIEVNDPLKYAGFTIYQASYGLLGYRAEIKAEDTHTGRVYSFAAAVGDRLAIGDTGYAFTFTGAQENYQNAGPALNLEVEAPDGASQPVWIFKESPDFDKLRGGRFVFSYVGEEEVYYTGLSVAKNPGLPLVWIGCFVLFIGLMVSFTVAHRWAAVRSDRGKLVATYSASKYRDVWRARFEEAVKAIGEGRSE